MRGEGRRDAESDLNLPPGFRFHPTDDELVVHYLCRKAAHQRLPVPIIAEVDLYKFDPWELPEKALFGRREWYFFTPRDRKYPNGSRPNRAAGRGYWKATGADKPVTPPGSARPLAIKKALVFYHGKAPKGIKTDWIMHEYRLADTNRSVGAGKKGGLRLDEWVLCRLYNKKNTWEKMMQQKEMEASLIEKSSSNDVTGSDSVWTPESDIDHSSPDHIDLKPEIYHEPQLYSGFQATTQQHQQQQQQQQQIVKEDQDWFMDLNLDDLQSSLMGFGSAPRMDLPSSQEYYFPAMPSPQMRPGQGGFPPF